MNRGQQAILHDHKHLPRNMSGEEIDLEPGDKVPVFEAKDESGELFSSSTLIGQRYVLYFYPKDDTPGCTIQACDFRDNMASLTGTGISVFGISKDGEASHTKFKEKFDLPFPLLVDENLSMQKAFGVWREKKNYGKTYMGTVRSTFVVAADGTLEWVGYNVRAKGHVERLMSELDVGA